MISTPNRLHVMHLYWDEDNSPNHSLNNVNVQTVSGVSAGMRQIKVRNLKKKKMEGTECLGRQNERRDRVPVKVSLDL